MAKVFTFLGTGGSSGTPRIGCRCAVCTSSHPHNRRLRPSGLLKIDGKVILIDLSPDYRQQALCHHLDRVDGVLLTHTHYDHIAGIDELRIYYVLEQKIIPCLLSSSSAEDLKKRYSYLFEKKSSQKSLTAQIALHVLEKKQGFIQFLDIPIHYFTFYQAGMPVTGFRIGNFAYISDIRDYDEDIFTSLQGVQILILSALKKESSSVHLSLQEAVDFARKVGSYQTWLTHLSHSLEHEATNHFLPPDVQLGYDGQEIVFS